MAKSATKSSAPSPKTDIAGNPVAEAWTPPDSDQEFTFTSMADAPAWVDPGWAGFDRGPALQVPAGDLYGDGPYHTKVARVGDKVIYTAPKGASTGKIDVIPSEPDPKEGGTTRKPPQQSACSLEDAIKTGAMAIDDLGDDAKAQVVGRSPGLRTMIEDGKGAPEAQSIGDVVKLD